MSAAAKIRLKLIAVDAKMLSSTPAVIAIAAGGAKYQLRHRPADMAAAERLADRIAARGTIDPALWDLVGTLPNSRAHAFLQQQSAAERESRLRAEAERALAA